MEEERVQLEGVTVTAPAWRTSHLQAAPAPAGTAGGCAPHRLGCWDPATSRIFLAPGWLCCLVWPGSFLARVLGSGYVLQDLLLGRAPDLELGRPRFSGCWEMLEPFPFPPRAPCCPPTLTLPCPASPSLLQSLHPPSSHFCTSSPGRGAAQKGPGARPALGNLALAPLCVLSQPLHGQDSRGTCPFLPAKPEHRFFEQPFHFI